MTKLSTSDLIVKVHQFIVDSEGTSVGEAAKALALPKTRIASAIRKLKDNGDIKQGGERRFARYAVTKAAAVKKSEYDRANAGGPNKGKTASKPAKKGAAKKKSGTTPAPAAAPAPAKKPPLDSGPNTLTSLSNLATETEVHIRMAANNSESILQALQSSVPEGPFRSSFASIFLKIISEESRRMGVTINTLMQLSQEKEDASEG